MQMWSYSSIWKCRERYPERKNRNCICGENGISRNAVSIRHTEKECGYPESAHGIRAGLHTMAPEVCPVARKIHSLCTFQTGKRYNCDLSASYNIGARYFIRELLKPLPATERSLLEAKVPSVKRRTSCVYADLKELHLQMEILKAA